MLAVVQLHDFSTDVGLQGSIVVGQVWERVLVPGRCGLVQSLAQAGSTPGKHREGIIVHTSKHMPLASLRSANVAPGEPGTCSFISQLQDSAKSSTTDMTREPHFERQVRRLT